MLWVVNDMKYDDDYCVIFLTFFTNEIRTESYKLFQGSKSCPS